MNDGFEPCCQTNRMPGKETAQQEDRQHPEGVYTEADRRKGVDFMDIGVFYGNFMELAIIGAKA